MQQATTLFTLQNELIEKKVEVAVNNNLVAFRQEFTDFRAEIRHTMQEFRHSMQELRLTTCRNSAVNCAMKFMSNVGNCDMKCMKCASNSEPA